MSGSLWILHGSDTLHDPWALSYPGECLLMNVFEIFLLLLEYGTGRTFYFASHLFCSIFVYLCWLTVTYSTCWCHCTWAIHWPIHGQEGPLVTAPDKTSPLRVFCLHLKSKNSSLNKGVFPNLCCILVLTAESLQGCWVWVVAQALPQDGKAASAPGRSVNHTGQCRWAQLQKSQALRKQTSPWLGEDHGIWLFLRRRKFLLLNWREAVVTSVLHFPVFN